MTRQYPDETAGWVKTQASRSTSTPGCNYENPDGTREFVIIGYPTVHTEDTHRVKDTPVQFKYNPHTEPGERVTVTGFETEEEAAQYGINWMNDNPVGDTDMGNNSGGLMSFTGGVDEEEQDTVEEDDRDDDGEEDTIPVIQHNSMALLSEYNKDGKYLGESPGARGISRPAEMPAKDDWPEAWVDKTDEFEHYQEGKDDRVRNRKRVTCECGLSMDVTGTCLTLVCHRCGLRLIDMDPADSPGETSSKKDNKTNKNLSKDDTQEADDNKQEQSSESEKDSSSSGLQAFVNSNS